MLWFKLKYGLISFVKSYNNANSYDEFKRYLKRDYVEASIKIAGWKTNKPFLKYVYKDMLVIRGHINEILIINGKYWGVLKFKI